MRVRITNRTHIELLVNTFYDRVKVHPVLGPIFNDMAKVDWNMHLPKMYNFWASILLGDQSYE
ncbi:MAG TPA: group III truncated hemoglobin, partial [Bacteroidia bacterium]|nr:group III truncated hemoglobin [Bacteroidia bacterium]